MEAAPSDVRRHQQFWNGFCRFLTIGSVSVAVILVLMALFLL